MNNAFAAALQFGKGLMFQFNFKTHAIWDQSLVRLYIFIGLSLVARLPAYTKLHKRMETDILREDLL